MRTSRAQPRIRWFAQNSIWHYRLMDSEDKNFLTLRMIVCRALPNVLGALPRGGVRDAKTHSKGIELQIAKSNNLASSPCISDVDSAIGRLLRPPYIFRWCKVRVTCLIAPNFPCLSNAPPPSVRMKHAVHYFRLVSTSRSFFLAFLFIHALESVARSLHRARFRAKKSYGAHYFSALRNVHGSFDKTRPRAREHATTKLNKTRKFNDKPRCWDFAFRFS